MADVATGSVLLTPRFDNLTATIKSQVEAALGAAEGTARGKGSSAGASFSTGFAAKAGAIAGLVQEAVGKACSAIRGSLDSAIARVDTMNNFPKVMSGLGYSADDASASISRMSDHLTGLPTRLDAMTSSVQKIVPTVKDVGRSTDIMLAFNDALLAGGASTQVQEAALEQFTQVLAKGKPELEDWRSIQTAMPGQLDQVAKSMLGAGASSNDLYNALKEGKVSVEDLENAFISLDSNGYGGFDSFAQQAKNGTAGIATSFANMQNAVTKAVAKCIDAIGSDAISSGIQSVGNAIKWVGDVAAGAIGQAKGWLEGLFSALESNGTMAAFSSAWGALSGILAGISIPSLSQLVPPEAAAGAIAGIAGAIASLAPSAEALSGSFSALWQSVAPVAEQLAGQLAAALQQIAPVVPTIAEAVMAVATAALPLVAQLIAQIAPLISSIIPVLASAIAALVPALMSLVSSVLPVLSAIIAALIPVVASVAQTVAGVVIPLIGTISGVIQGVIQVIQGVLDFLTGVFTGNWSQAWAGVRSIFSGIWQAISSLLSGVWSAMQALISGGLSTVQALWNAAWSAVSSLFSSIWEGIKSAASNGVSAVVSVVTGVKDKITGFFAGAGSWLVDSGAAILNGLKDGILGAIGSVTGAVSGALSQIRGLFPFSPAKYGPFSGHGYTTYSGAALMGDFGESIGKAAPHVAAAAQSAVAEVHAALAVEPVRFAAVDALPIRAAYAPAAAPSGQSGKVVNVYIDGQLLQIDSKVLDIIEQLVAAIERRSGGGRG